MKILVTISKPVSELCQHNAVHTVTLLVTRGIQLQQIWTGVFDRHAFREDVLQLLIFSGITVLQSKHKKCP